MLVTAAAIGGVLALASPGLAAAGSRRVASRHLWQINALAPAASGSRSGQRIVGGSAAAITSFPFQVALWDPSAPSQYVGQGCGGTIVDATHVVTAAHCVFDFIAGQAVRPADLHVLAGTAHLRSADEPGYGAEVKDLAAAAVSFDPGFNLLQHDAALLTLAGPLFSGTPAPDGSTSIAPIPLITSSQAAAHADPALGSPVTVSGWGDVNPEPVNAAPAPDFPQDLRSVQTHLVADSTCQQSYTPLGVTLTANSFCAGEPAGGKDACLGDSGGPLVVDVADTPNPPADYALAGIVSGGAGCAQAGVPGVYTRIASPAITSFLTSSPPDAPRRGSDATLSGTPHVGQVLTCNPGSWTGSPTSFAFQFGVDRGPDQEPVLLTQPSPNPSYTPTAADLGAAVFCEVRAANAGGYGFGDSADVTILPALPAPPVTPATDRTPPALTVSMASRVSLRTIRKGLKVPVSCSEACSINVNVSVSRATARRLHLKKTTLGLAAARLASSGSTTITVRFARSVLKHLTARKIKTAVRVRAVDSSNNATTKSRTLTLTR